MNKDKEKSDAKDTVLSEDGAKKARGRGRPRKDKKSAYVLRLEETPQQAKERVATTKPRGRPRIIKDSEHDATPAVGKAEGAVGGEVPKKQRGRPRKDHEEPPEEKEEKKGASASKRPRGRPRK
jgi:hypothetical protein